MRYIENTSLNFTSYMRRGYVADTWIFLSHRDPDFINGSANLQICGGIWGFSR